MMRGKAIKFKNGESKVRDKVLSSTDFMGKTLAKPVISNVVNSSNKNKILEIYLILHLKFINIEIFLIILLIPLGEKIIYQNYC